MKFLHALAVLVCLASMLAAGPTISLDQALGNPPQGPYPDQKGSLRLNGHVWVPEGWVTYGRAVDVLTDGLSSVWATGGTPDQWGPTWYSYHNVGPGTWNCYGRSQYTDNTGKTTTILSNKINAVVK
jgi:hypothetical protein